MIQDSITIEQRHRKFVEKVCETQIIYALKGNNGFATSFSNNYETEDNEEITLICFWSEAILAKVLARHEWSTYKVEEISLASFLENWCIGMHNDGLYMGTNFDQNLFGFEIEPLDLAMEIINEIKKQKYEITLRNYDSLEEYEENLKQALEE